MSEDNLLERALRVLAKEIRRYGANEKLAMSFEDGKGSFMIELEPGGGVIVRETKPDPIRELHDKYLEEQAKAVLGKGDPSKATLAYFEMMKAMKDEIEEDSK